MSGRSWNLAYVLLTIVFTVYGQMIVKWRIGQFGSLPEPLAERLGFLVKLVFDPLIFSGFAAAFLASLAWMAALTRLDLSVAYPFMSLNFVVVLLLSAWLLGEPVTMAKGIGVALIVMGTVIATT